MDSQPRSEGRLSKTQSLEEVSGEGGISLDLFLGAFALSKPNSS
jgi:hypothetical protein